MLFVPNPITRTLKPLETGHDVVKLLRQHVLPHYEDVTNFPVTILKSDCMSVVKCIYEAGKIKNTLDFNNIGDAIEYFMSTDLWIPIAEIQRAGIAPALEFERWNEPF